MSRFSYAADAPFYLDSETTQALLATSQRLIAERRAARMQREVSVPVVQQWIMDRRMAPLDRRQEFTMDRRLAEADRRHVERRQYANRPEPISGWGRL